MVRRQRIVRQVSIVLALMIALTGAPWAAAPPVAGQGPADPLDLVARFRVPSESLDALADVAVDDVPASVTEPVDLDAGIETAIALIESLPLEEWQVDDLASMLGPDPVAAFAFVRDRIAFEPYPGVLRGDEGTLAAHAGNAYDRALLLRALLDAQGVESRFAFATLDDTASRQVVGAAMRPLLDPESPGTDASFVGYEPERVLARARRDYARLRLALDASGEHISDESRMGQAIADVRRHAWIQVRTDEGWLDLDPSLPGSGPGEVLAAAEITADTIPDDGRQGLRLELIADVLDDGALEERTVLSARLDVAEAARDDIVLAFALDDGGSGGPLAGSLSAETSYVPILLGGDEGITGEPLRMGGEPQEDIFGNPVAVPEVVSLRLRAVREAPGREPDEAVRVLLERRPEGFPPDWVPTPQELRPLAIDEHGPIAMQAVHHVMVSNGSADPLEQAALRAASLEAAAASLLDPDVAAHQGLAGTVWPLLVSDMLLVIASERVIVPALGERSTAVDPGPVIRPIVDRPRVYLSSFGPDPEVPGELGIVTDLLIDDVLLLASTDVPSGELVHRQLWYGALQSALETELLLRRAVGLVDSDRRLESVSLSMYEPLTVLGPSDDAMAVGSDALRLGLEDGRIAAVPGDPRTAGVWWLVDAAGGATRSVLGPGVGGSKGFGKGYNPFATEGRGHTGYGEWQVSEDLQHSYRIKTGAQQGKTVRTGKKKRSDCGQGGTEGIGIIRCVSIPLTQIVNIAGVAIVVGLAYFAYREYRRHSR